jgi:hypothetical protein
MQRAMSFENRLHWEIPANENLSARIKSDFEELFNPSETHWKTKAMQDADLAFNGILLAEGYILNESNTPLSMN